MLKFNGTGQEFYRGEPPVCGGCCRAEDAFTLVELIAATGIIAMLAAMAVPSYAAYIKKARINRCIVEIRVLEQEIAGYAISNDRLPNTLDDIGRGDLKDPWGRPYQYMNIADSDSKGKGKLRRDRFLNPLNADFDLYSMGEDGESKPNLNAEPSQDDIVRANGGAFIGLASVFDPKK